MSKTRQKHVKDRRGTFVDLWKVRHKGNVFVKRRGRCRYSRDRGLRSAGMFADRSKFDALKPYFLRTITRHGARKASRIDQLSRGCIPDALTADLSERETQRMKA